MQWPPPKLDEIQVFLYRVHWKKKISRIHRLFFVEEATPETTLLIGNQKEMFQIRIPGDLRICNLQIPWIMPPLPKTVRRKEEVGQAIPCNFNMSAIYRLIERRKEAFQLIKKLFKMKCFTNKERGSFLEKFIKEKRSLTEILNEARAEHYKRQNRRKKIMRRIKRENKFFKEYFTKHLCGQVLPLPDGGYLVFTCPPENDMYSFLFSDVYCCYHVSKDGVVQRFTTCGAAARAEVLKLLKRGGKLSTGATVTSRSLLDRIANLLGKVDPALTLVIKPS